MPGAAYLNSLCSGHGCFPSRQASSASENVFINDIGAHRSGDLWQPHSCQNNVHDGILMDGSGTVFVNDTPKGRIGDQIDCGSFVLTGSDNVEVGG